MYCAFKVHSRVHFTSLFSIPERAIWRHDVKTLYFSLSIAEEIAHFWLILLKKKKLKKCINCFHENEVGQFFVLFLWYKKSLSSMWNKHQRNLTTIYTPQD